MKRMSAWKKKIGKECLTMSISIRKTSLPSFPPFSNECHLPPSSSPTHAVAALLPPSTAAASTPPSHHLLLLSILLLLLPPPSPPTTLSSAPTPAAPTRRMPSTFTTTPAAAAFSPTTSPSLSRSRRALGCRTCIKVKNCIARVLYSDWILIFLFRIVSFACTLLVGR